jgi:hypothetical protein
MLHRIKSFLRAIFQELHPARISSTQQATRHIIHEQHTDILHPISTMKKDLKDTDMLPMMPASVRERTTEPYQAIIRLKNPAQRYRKLDAMLEQLKRDRLNNTDTLLVQGMMHGSARELQRFFEQEEKRKNRNM